MKASEILHGLAELLAGIESGQGQSNQNVPQQPNKAELVQVQVDHSDGTDSTTMVPPLQQKIELLKKSLQVDNEFDKGFDQVDQQYDQPGANEVDDLSRMKQMAGIKTFAQQELAKDEPLDA